MGMANSDDETAIAENDALNKWARNFPESPGSWDYPADEESQYAYEEQVRKHVSKKPKVRDKYAD